MTLIARTKRETVQQSNHDQSIDSIVFEIETKSKELQELSSNFEVIKEKIRVSRAEHSRLLKQNAEAEISGSINERASKEARDAVSVLVKKGQILRVDIAKKMNEVQTLENEIALYHVDIASGKRAIEEMKIALEDAKLNLSGLYADIDGITKNITDLQAEEKEWRDKIEALKSEQATILANIETSIENFRIFEWRIAKLSEETGYIVGYPKVEAPQSQQ